MTTEIRYLDAYNPTGDFEVVEPRSKGVEYDLEHFSASDGRHWWIKVTNETAKDFRALARPRHGGEWREIVPHRPGTRLDGIVAFATFFVLIERFEGFPTLRLAPALTGEDPFGPSLLDHASLINAEEQPASVFLSANAEYETEWLRVQIGSMVTPRYVADVNVSTGDRVIRKRQRVKGAYDPHNYVTGRLWVSASDGVQIPVTVVARRGVLELGEDGQLLATTPAPLLLYGYGSYEASMDPYFSSMRLSLLDRGIIFAVAHVRGGGELGRSWYEMGRLEQKATTFSDFVAVARSLVDLGWTTPDQLAARGGSAGGLLMGAVMNLAPELFRCVVAEVPFVDALTTMLDASLPLTVGEWEEWGNPDASEITYRIMKGYSPYDNVSSTNDDKSPRRYPRLLATCGLNDSRVGFWEAAKWVLRLRDANGANQAFLKVEMGSGHAGPSGRYDSWRDEAYSLAFIASAVNATQRLA
jgi:oligopeptidase B